MRTFVLDTSVAAAWYLPEVFAAAARRWQARVLEGRIRLVVPSLHYWEMASVLRTYVRRSELAADLAAEIYSLHLEAPLEVVEPERGAVLRTSLELDATVYDAVFVAVSRELGAPLLTAERRTTAWVAKLGRLVQHVDG